MLEPSRYPSKAKWHITLSNHDNVTYKNKQRGRSGKIAPTANVSVACYTCEACEHTEIFISVKIMKLCFSSPSGDLQGVYFFTGTLLKILSMENLG